MAARQRAISPIAWKNSPLVSECRETRGSFSIESNGLILDRTPNRGGSSQMTLPLGTMGPTNAVSRRFAVFSFAECKNSTTSQGNTNHFYTKGCSKCARTLLEHKIGTYSVRNITFVCCMALFAPQARKFWRFYVVFARFSCIFGRCAAELGPNFGRCAADPRARVSISSMTGLKNSPPCSRMSRNKGGVFPKGGSFSKR